MPCPQAAATTFFSEFSSQNSVNPAPVQSLCAERVTLGDRAVLNQNGVHGDSPLHTRRLPIRRLQSIIKIFKKNVFLIWMNSVSQLNEFRFLSPNSASPMALQAELTRYIVLAFSSNLFHSIVFRSNAFSRMHLSYSLCILVHSCIFLCCLFSSGKPSEPAANLYGKQESDVH